MNPGYDLEFDWANSHGHIARLLIDHVDPGVVVDLGCGFAPHAEVLRDHGFAFVGLDVEADAVEGLRARGFSAGDIDLNAAGEIGAALDRLDLGGPVAAVLALDVLEHLVMPQHVLAAIRSWMLDNDASILGTSIPNVSYEDIALKLITARWDMTPTGLLDQTHLRFFTDSSLTAFLRSAGFVEHVRNDVPAPFSDQYWPVDLPTISAATTLGRFLRRVRAIADEHAHTHQFVRLHRLDASIECAPSLVPRSSTLGVPHPGPFLSVLVAPGSGDVDLVDQTSGDHELIRATDRSDLGSMLESARGRYVAFLDGRQRPQANWVEQFRSAATDRPGMILRCAPAETVADPDRWDDRFDWGSHLVAEASPQAAFAFPLAPLRDLDVVVGEPGLTDAHSLLLEIGSFCGVFDTGVPALAVQPGWRGGVDRDALQAARKRLDAAPFVVEAGAAQHLAALTERVADLEGHITALEADNRWLNEELGLTPVRALRRVLRRGSGPG